MQRPTILFLHAVYPNQFVTLVDYLNASGLANALLMTSPGHKKRYGPDRPELLAFEPDGPIVGPQSYYFSAKVERSARISRGMLQAIHALQRRQHIDLVVAHHMWGAPLFLFDELNLPIVSYVEFPSYRAHGWDRAYPPTDSQRITDANMEMLTLHQVMRSRLTIVPTEYARSLLPEELQHKVFAQFEGFDMSAAPALPAPLEYIPPARTLGFAASGLCSAKGYEQFVRVSHHINSMGVAPIRFVAIGDPARAAYSYESHFLASHQGGRFATFHDYLADKYPASRVEVRGKLPFAEFAQALTEIDLFLYPLQFGVGNWGLIELLSRGRAVIGSTRCFLPEIIEDGHNGYLVDGAEQAWAERILSLLDDPATLRRIQHNALQSARRFSIEQVAPRYMQLFEMAMGTLGRAPTAGG